MSEDKIEIGLKQCVQIETLGPIRRLRHYVYGSETKTVVNYKNGRRIVIVFGATHCGSKRWKKIIEWRAPQQSGHSDQKA